MSLENGPEIILPTTYLSFSDMEPSFSYKNIQTGDKNVNHTDIQNCFICLCETLSLDQSSILL